MASQWLSWGVGTARGAKHTGAASVGLQREEADGDEDTALTPEGPSAATRLAGMWRAGRVWNLGLSGEAI